MTETAMDIPPTKREHLRCDCSLFDKKTVKGYGAIGIMKGNWTISLNRESSHRAIEKCFIRANVLFQLRICQTSPAVAQSHNRNSVPDCCSRQHNATRAKREHMPITVLLLLNSSDQEL